MIEGIIELRKWLAGKKTYITAVLVGIFAGLHVYGVEIPPWIWPVLSAMGLGSVRAAIKKLEK